MSLWSKVRGTVETIFQLGLGGPQLKGNAGAVESRNAGDSAFAVMRAASPVGDNDVTTKTYVDSLAARYVISGQFNGGNALPANSATEQFLVVTTTGANGTIGQLIWDDGLNVGTAQVLAAAGGRMIITQAALSGGTVTFQPDSLYAWDSSASAWVNAGGTLMSGAIREVRTTLSNAASQSSAQTIPANAIITECALDVTTPYSAGATISVGRTGSTSLMMATTDSLATVAGVYSVPQDTAFGGSALPVLVTVAGAPAAGVASLVVKYSVPDA